MQLFTSVVRQYTPPTCWLEIEAKESPLSRWAGVKVFDKLRFELRFNDPRLPEEKQITIWGSRAELEALYEAVTSYAQNFVEQSPNQLLVAVGSPASNGSMLARTSDDDNNHHSTALPTSRINTFVQNSEELEQGYPPEQEAPLPMRLAATPYLQPRGLLAHELFLGPLETEESGPVVLLSALQLFDLVTALEEYASDIVTLPKIDRQVIVQPDYIKYAVAAGVLLAVGVTIVIYQLLHRPERQVALAPTPQPTPTDLQTPLDTNLPTGASSPSPTPLVPLPPGATPLASPSPGATPPPLTPGTSPGLGLSGGTTSGLGATGSPSLGTSPGVVIPGMPYNSGGSPPLQPQPNFSRQVPSYTTPVQPPLRQVPPPKAASSTSPQHQQSRTTTTASRSVNKTPRLGNLPPVNRSTGSSTSNDSQRDTSTLPQLSAGSTAPPIAFNPDLTNQTLPSDLGVSQGAANSAEPNSVASSNTSNSTAQAEQAKKYLAKRWHPPQGLAQPLKYTVEVDSDGTVKRIIPLGPEERKYIDSSGLPQPGSSFVAPGHSYISVDLNSDGSVDTSVVP